MFTDTPEGRQSFNRHYGNHLKPLSTNAIQDAIAKTITRLTGGFAYACNIEEITYTQGDDPKGARIVLRLRRDTEKDDDSVKTEGEREYERERAARDQEPE